MGLYIDDLEISYSAKNMLHELGFTMVSDLEGHDYVSLIQKFPLKRHYVAAIIHRRKAQPPAQLVEWDSPPGAKPLHFRLKAV